MQKKKNIFLLDECRYDFLGFFCFVFLEFLILKKLKEF